MLRALGRGGLLAVAVVLALLGAVFIFGIVLAFFVWPWQMALIVFVPMLLFLNRVRIRRLLVR